MNFPKKFLWEKLSGTFKLPRDFRKTESARGSPNLFITLMKKVNSGNEHGSRENLRSRKLNLRCRVGENVAQHVFFKTSVT